MKKYYIVIFLMVFGVSNLGQTIAAQAQPGRLIFSEVQVGSSTSASQEFIELYNSGETTLDINKWRVQYASSGSTNWDKPSRTIELSGSLTSHNYLLIASSDYLTDLANYNFSSTLSQTGGNLRLINGSGNTQDNISWGTAKLAAGQPAPAPPSGQSLARVESDNLTASTDNANDFDLTSSVTPGTANVITEAAQSSVGAQQTFISNSAPGAPLEISELLPNPGSPKTDANDEFIEFYNPTDETVSLAGYKITTGTNDSYKYTFKSGEIEAGGYYVIYSKLSRLTLSNTAGKAKLFGPDGGLIDETQPYSKAADNQAWVFSGNNWQWTAEPTPGQPNILVVPAAAGTKTKAATKTSASKSTKKSRVSTVAAKKTGAGTSESGAGTNTQNQIASRGIHPLMLASMASLVVVYACYEYRHDISNRLHRFRENRTARRLTRKTSAPADSARTPV